MSKTVAQFWHEQCPVSSIYYSITLTVCPTVVWWCWWFFIHSLSLLAMAMSMCSVPWMAMLFCCSLVDGPDSWFLPLILVWSQMLPMLLPAQPLCVHMCHHYYTDIDLSLFHFLTFSFFPLESKPRKWCLQVVQALLLFFLKKKFTFFAIKRKKERKKSIKR